jgi:hypothetical protein
VIILHLFPATPNPKNLYSTQKKMKAKNTLIITGTRQHGYNDYLGNDEKNLKAPLLVSKAAQFPGLTFRIFWD